MKIVQRGNKQLRVADDRLEDMLKAGYTEIDQKTGKPIVVESDLDKEVNSIKMENKDLKKQVADLTAQLEGIKKAK